MKKRSGYLLRGVPALMCALQLAFSGCAAQTVPETETKIPDNRSVVSLSEDDTQSKQEDNNEALPNVTGKWVGEACDILDDCGVQYEITYEYVENVEKKRVISQTPSEGSPIESGMTVKLIVCGEKKDTVSKSESKTESTGESKSESKTESKAESQTPSQAPADTTQKMPNIVGMDVTAATQTLDSMGIYYTGNYQFNDTVPYGQVISQEPEAGTDAPKGSRITFIISNGKQPEQEIITYETYEEQPQQDYTPAEEPQPSNTQAEPDMSGGDDFRGFWYSFRPTAKITKKKNGQYLVKIIWSSSAYDGLMWSFFADYDPYQGILTYNDGIELKAIYEKSRQEWVGHYPLRYNLSGYLKINDNGEMLWYDDGVDGSSDIVFKKYNN